MGDQVAKGADPSLPHVGHSEPLRGEPIIQRTSMTGAMLNPSIGRRTAVIGAVAEKAANQSGYALQTQRKQSYTINGGTRVIDQPLT
jgi:hypothetical protein